MVGGISIWFIWMDFVVIGVFVGNDETIQKSNVVSDKCLPDLCPKKLCIEHMTRCYRGIIIQREHKLGHPWTNVFICFIFERWPLVRNWFV